MTRWEVTPKESGIRLVYFLQKRVPKSYSARFWKRVVEKNLCRVNGFRERFGSKVLKTNDLIQLEANWEKISSEKPKEQFTTLYEDEYLVIIDKTPGIISLEENFAPLILTHRLDKDTSGILILAKNHKAKEQMMEIFAKREITKRYLAIVHGEVKHNEGKCQSFLKKKASFQGGVIWGSSYEGVEAITEWQALQKNPKASLILCQPKTGRTHQIRVHMAELSHPIIGDYQYGRKVLSDHYAGRQLLHAYQIEFNHPVDGKLVQIESSIPDDFLEAAESLNLENSFG